MSHDQPPDGGQPLIEEPAAEPVVQVPQEEPAEVTAPLPPIAQFPPRPSGTHQQDHRTAGLPLIDLLAPQQFEPPQPSPSMDPTEYGVPPYSVASAYADPYSIAPPYSAESGYPDAPSYSVAPPYWAESPPGRSRRLGRPGAKLVAAVGVGVLLIAVLGIWALSTSGPSGQQSQQGQQSRPGGLSTSLPTSTLVRAAGGYQFTQHAARSDTDCAANAYGKVADFFRTTPCTSLDRALYSTTIDGRLAVASVSVVRMPTEQAAADLKKLADSNGTGNINDLLRAGVRVSSGPDSLTDAGFASTRDGATVAIAESDFADRAVQDEKLLDQISEAAVQLRK